jgi:2-keto-3-deoxy-L-rhamnonate aldolase RhmA
MAENRLKERWKAGKAAVNGWLTIPSGFSAEVMAQCVLAACRKRGIYPGIHCGEPAYAARMIRMGFRLTTVANDSGLMAKAAREAVAGVWREVGEFR